MLTLKIMDGVFSQTGVYFSSKLNDDVYFEKHMAFFTNMALLFGKGLAASGPELLSRFFCALWRLSSGQITVNSITVVSFKDLNIDIFLEVQNKRYRQILYLIDYVVPGLHFW